MNLTHPYAPLSARRWAILASLVVSLSSSIAQTAQTPQASQTPGSTTPATVSDPSPIAPSPSPIASSPSPKDDDTITLSPFIVDAAKDDGFVATNAGTATKLGLDMKDIGAAYSVMTGEFISALGITDLQDAILWSTNGSPVFDGQGADLYNIPSIANVRGVVLHTGQQRDFFLTGAISDTYNTERIDFGRGPNAVLFNVGANDALGGGISFVGKRARFDRDTDDVSVTTGSWDYYRTALDVNRVFGKRLAVRANGLLQKRGGWLQNEFENRKGITLAGTYRFAPKTELRFEGSYDIDERSRPAIGLFDNLSAWNGSTVFNGRITNAMVSSNATPGAVYGLTYNGEEQGVWRQASDLFVYDPDSGSIMNWIHTGYTRRGDETNRTPIWLGTTPWTRGGNAFFQPVGNGGGSGGNTKTPGVGANGGNASFFDAINFPDNRFDIASSKSHFRAPGSRTTLTPSDPLFEQHNKSATISFTHQIGDSLFIDVAANFTRTANSAINSHLGLRTLSLDLNETLPNGQQNRNFLQAFGQMQAQWYRRTTDNAGFRANFGYIKDLGKWGHYTFNMTLGANLRDTVQRQYVRSVAIAADPREWQAQRITTRYYLGGENRAFVDNNSSSLFQVVPVSGGNSGYTTSEVPIQARWVLNDWWDNEEETKSLIFAFAGKYFKNRLVVSPGIRIDDQTTYRRVKANSWGFMPSDNSWDGITLSDAYWRPDAPSDWLALAYLPRNANGTPSSSVPIPAITRPTSGGVNGVNPANPLYANDRFRSDYNNPKYSKRVMAKNLGLVYHGFDWMSVKLSFADSYKPSDIGRMTLEGVDAEPETGISYEAGLTFSFFRNKLTATPRYYFNRVENLLGTSPIVSPIDSLMGCKPWNDTSTSGRNILGYTNVLGQDSTARKNEGFEIELVGRITKGWRISGSFGSAQRTDYDRWPQSQAYVMSRANEFLEVLKAAGGALDNSGTYGSLKSPSAPGYAIKDPAITDAMITTAGGSNTVRNNALLYYNNIWTQYDVITTLKDTVGLKRTTMNLFTDYQVQSGTFKGLRFGAGLRWVDKDIAGYRSGDTIANPAYNAALPASATNLPYIDDPDVDANTPVWIKRPWEVTATFAYTRRLKSNFRILNGRELNLNLIIKNLTNNRMVSYQDDGVVLRAPDGDLTQNNRVAVPGRIANYQRPINFELTIGLKY